jgi:hypothetical protein
METGQLVITGYTFGEELPQEIETYAISTNSIWDNKGDLLVGLGADSGTNLSVGADGKVLTADSSRVAGVVWSYPVSQWAIRLVSVNDDTVVTRDINSETYIDFADMSFLCDTATSHYTYFRILVYGNSSESGETVTCQLALASDPTTALSPDGNDLSVSYNSGNPMLFDSDWVALDDPDSLADEVFCVAMKGSSATVDLELKYIDVHFKVAPKLCTDPPTEPYAPNPEDEELEAAVNLILSWSGGSPCENEEVTYDVYLEACSYAPYSPDILIDAGISSTQLAPSTLNYGTYYCWQVIARDTQAQETYGPVWRFLTIPEPEPTPIEEPPEPEWEPPADPTPTKTTYYIAASGGSDSNNGSIGAPWATFAHAYTTMVAGDRLYVRGGTYDQRIVPTKSGTAINQIIIEAYTGETPIIRGVSTEEEIVYISQQSYNCFIGLTFRHKDSDHWATRYPLFMIYDSSESGKCTGNKVIRCTFIRQGDQYTFLSQGKKERGIEIVNAISTFVSSCYFYGMNIGVYVRRESIGTIIYNNHITHCCQSCIDFGSSRVTGRWRNSFVVQNIIEGSLIEDGVQFEPNYDADSTTSLDNVGCIIRGNIIKNNAENAIDLKGARYVVIERNFIMGTIGSDDGAWGPLVGGSNPTWNRFGGTAVMRGGNTNTRDVIIRRNVLYDNFGACWLYEGFRCYHNTFVANNRDYEKSDSTYYTDKKPNLYGPAHMAGNVVIKNNIVMNHNNAEVQVRTNGGSVYTNNNLYYNSRTLKFVDYRANYDCTYLTGLSAWQSYLNGKGNITGKDANSAVGDPLFAGVAGGRPVSGGTYNFTLTAGSPAIDAAMPITYTTSAGSGTTVPVADPLYFSHGMGHIAGDTVIIDGTAAVAITGISITNKTITIAASRSWGNNGAIYIEEYNGSAPDIGAYEYEP